MTEHALNAAARTAGHEDRVAVGSLGLTGRRRLLTAGEEIRLAKRIQLGDKRAKQEMVECNLGLVYAVAKPYRGCGVPFADLMQEGTVGLIKAVERFDHQRGLRFSTYGVWWIRRALMDAIGASRTIRIPPQAAQQMAAVRRAEDELRRPDRGSASTEEIAGRTGLSPRSVTALRGAARVTASLDEPMGADARALSEVIEDPQSASPDELFAENEQRRETWALLRVLPERHRQVLIRRYGIGGGPVQSHREIGERLGVREERSRQLEREALHRLRELTAPSQRAA